MTADVHKPRTPVPMVLAFPPPGPRVRLAYWEIHLAVNGTTEENRGLGKQSLLPRPWEPSTCLDPGLRLEVWQWLEEVVTWLNREYTWDVANLVPTCWPCHPHLVHEIAVVADQRRRAGLAMTSDALEEWHRYCLPAFLDRMRTKLRSSCEDGHQGWPGRPRHNEHGAENHTRRREDVFSLDVEALPTGRDRKSVV